MKKKHVVCFLGGSSIYEGLKALILLIKDPHVSVDLIIVENYCRVVRDLIDWLKSYHTKICYFGQYRDDQLIQLPKSQRHDFIEIKRASDKTLKKYLKHLDDGVSATFFNFGGKYLSKVFAKLKTRNQRKIKRIFSEHSFPHVENWSISGHKLEYTPYQLRNLMNSCPNQEGRLFYRLLGHPESDNRYLISVIAYLDYLAIEPEIRSYENNNFIVRFNSQKSKDKIRDRVYRNTDHSYILRYDKPENDWIMYFVFYVTLLILILIFVFYLIFLI